MGKTEPVFGSAGQTGTHFSFVNLCVYKAVIYINVLLLLLSLL
jgi:hypothetical protein